MRRYDVPTARRVRDRRGPAAGNRPTGRAARGRPGALRAAGRDRFGQDLRDGQGHREVADTYARAVAQQDLGSPALAGDERAVPRKRGGVLRQLLRLLPARGLHPGPRPLHRQGAADERTHRAGAFLHRGLPSLASGRHYRWHCLHHLRSEPARGVPAEPPEAGRGRPGRPAGRGPTAGRPAVPPHHRGNRARGHSPARRGTGHLDAEPRRPVAHTLRLGRHRAYPGLRGGLVGAAGRLRRGLDPPSRVLHDQRGAFQSVSGGHRGGAQ